MNAVDPETPERIYVQTDPWSSSTYPEEWIVVYNLPDDTVIWTVELDDDGPADSTST